MKFFLVAILFFPFFLFSQSVKVQVLGIAQDGGFPHAGCKKECCFSHLQHPEARKMVSCLGLKNEASNTAWMFEATPDFKFQQAILLEDKFNLKGIFLTHAHIGHYTGLMHLGREVMGAKQVPVFAMPRMVDFLKNNGPWSQLVSLENIVLQPLAANSPVALEEGITVTPILVPHRDEFSETVGYWVKGPNKQFLFIPDIDKWEKWDEDLINWLQKVDYAFLDATFFENKEVPGRDMSEIPHPFVVETMQKLENIPPSEKDKVYFIHFNHTNPVLQENSDARKLILKNGFHYAEEGMVFGL
ncbi:MAG: pyrroloquinoline quinone biosynthesis protein PqqB [Saprospiraceae bacterium]|nr:pyrroloquinoline quinone biosynthesis protein PqqB [Saprospiraceae bacterium]